MAWERVLGQAQAVALLRKAIASDRVAHAYLFHGPDGVGKRAAALAFAGTLQSEAAAPDPHVAGERRAMAMELRHPDVHFLLPYPSDAEPEEVGECLERVAKNPYAVVDFGRRRTTGKSLNKQSHYPISRIKEEIHPVLRLHPRLGGYRIVILTQAESMQAASGNALLKVLEEPLEQTVLILTSSRPDLLLSTIVSRCQRVRFAPLEESVIESALVERLDLAPSKARLYARMAGGSYAAAEEFATSEDLQKEREAALQLLRNAYTRTAVKQVALIDELIRGGREHIKAVLGQTQIWIRDMMLANTLRDQAHITNVDKSEVVNKLAERLQHADVEAMARLVDEGRTLTTQNVDAKLVLVSLSQALGRAMRGPSPDRLYVPLT